MNTEGNLSSHNGLKLNSWWKILLSFIVWPILLTLWIWKRDWNKKVRIGLIAGLWILILSLLSKQQSYQAGSQLNIVSTDSPTIVASIPSITSTKETPTAEFKPTVVFQPTKIPSSTKTFYNKNRGNSEKAAAFGEHLLTLIKKAAPGGSFDIYVEEADPSLFVQIKYEGELWSSTPDDLKKDLVAGFVMAARNEYPDYIPHIYIKTGFRTAAEGSFSIWSGEPTIELK